MCIFQRAEIKRTALFCLLASLLACAFGFEAAAASARTQRAKANLDKAQQKLQTAQQALDKALAQAQEAETARQTATNAFLKAQETAAAKYGAQFGVFAAVADRDALEGEVVKMRKAQDRPQRDLATAQGNVDRAASLYEQALAQDKRYNARHRRRSKRKSPRQTPRGGRLRR